MDDIIQMTKDIIFHCGDDVIANEIIGHLNRIIKDTNIRANIRYHDSHPCIFIARQDKKAITKSDRIVIDAFKNGYNAALKARNLYDQMDSGRRRPILNGKT